VDEKGEEIGTVTVLEREAGGSPITAVFWNNRYLYAEVLAEDGDAAWTSSMNSTTSVRPRPRLLRGLASKPIIVA
jgi:hypothetical protein